MRLARLSPPTIGEVSPSSTVDLGLPANDEVEPAPGDIRPVPTSTPSLVILVLACNGRGRPRPRPATKIPIGREFRHAVGSPARWPHPKNDEVGLRLNRR
ncbi:hypothetical protein NL676_038985 [Syzygium grande]|nr:hypothetical protein NL676_038985 [Syzygium grande]